MGMSADARLFFSHDGVQVCHFFVHCMLFFLFLSSYQKFKFWKKLLITVRKSCFVVFIQMFYHKTLLGNKNLWMTMIAFAGQYLTVLKNLYFSRNVITVDIKKLSPFSQKWIFIHILDVSPSNFFFVKFTPSSGVLPAFLCGRKHVSIKNIPIL